MILIFTYVAVFVFLVGLIWRVTRIARMPVHLRWELAPVPHEKGKANYGGSYLEEFEWWTKPREKSLINEGLYMFQEIVFLKGVWEKNRSLWFWSFPLHFGLYLLIGMVVCLILTSLGVSALGPVAQGLGGVGYVLGAIGAVGLLYRRLFDPKIKPFAALSSYVNLVFLGAVFVSGAITVFTGEFLTSMTSLGGAFFSADTSVAIGAAASAHIAIGMLFLIYMPFTYMMHFATKYFMYHEVRWNDEPIRGNKAMRKEVMEMLGQAPTWAAPHLGADGKKTWVDIATADVSEEGK
jgi:nitrate reductase gamma subunit